MTEDGSIELTPALREMLFNEAVLAKSNAYCPYSNFAVGAAVLTSDGRVFKGCNVENGSYGLTICAERNAIAAAVTAGCLNLIAVQVVTEAPTLARPCGGCRQVIVEFSNEVHPTVVISTSGLGETVTESINTLLPSRFNLL